jgi:hypothetical protein
MGHTGEGVPLLLSPRRVDAVLVLSFPRFNYEHQRIIGAA